MEYTDNTCGRCKHWNAPYCWCPEFKEVRYPLQGIGCHKFKKIDTTPQFKKIDTTLSF